MFDLKEVVFFIFVLFINIALSIIITFLIIRYAGIKEAGGLKEAKELIEYIKSMLLSGVFPIELKNIHFHGLPARGVKDRLAEAIKELNILFMIMRRELSLLVASLRLETVESEESVSIEELLDMFGKGLLGQNVIVRLPFEGGYGNVILSGEDLKRFCEEIRDMNSVRRFLELKRHIIKLINDMESKFYEHDQKIPK